MFLRPENPPEVLLKWPDQVYKTLRGLAMQPLSHSRDLLLVARYKRLEPVVSIISLSSPPELRNCTTALSDYAHVSFCLLKTGHGPGVAVKIA